MYLQPSYGFNHSSNSTLGEQEPLEMSASKGKQDLKSVKENIQVQTLVRITLLGETTAIRECIDHLIPKCLKGQTERTFLGRSKQDHKEPCVKERDEQVA